MLIRVDSVLQEDLESLLADDSSVLAGGLPAHHQTLIIMTSLISLGLNYYNYLSYYSFKVEVCISLLYLDFSFHVNFSVK